MSQYYKHNNKEVFPENRISDEAENYGCHQAFFPSPNIKVRETEF